MGSNIGSNPNKWQFQGIVSAQFNQLKAKLYNVIEASLIEEKQREAVKGLVKGFCNENYKNTIIDLEYFLKGLGVIDQNEGASIPPLSAEPLENR